MSIPPPPGAPEPQGPHGRYPAPPPSPYGTGPGPGPYGAAPGPHGAAPGAYGAAPGAYGAGPGPHAPSPRPSQAQSWYPPGLYPPPQQPPVNGLAITSLVLGLVCCLPGVGLIFGAVALRQIGRKGERGKGLAVAGVVLSSLGLALFALMLATGGASEFWKGVKEGAMEDVTVARGECFNTAGSLEGVTYDLDVVPCSDEHDAEVFATITLPESEFPGDDRISLLADDRCYALRADYAMDVWALPSHVDVYYLTPTRQSWRLGDREVTCLFGNTDQGGRLTGSLRNDRTNLDADQVAYLQAVRAVDAVLEKEPEDYPEDDLAANKDWAREVGDALAEQSAVLDGRAWPADAERPMAALVRELEAARDDWAKAAKAGSADMFYLHYDKAYEFYDGPTTIDVREALGLDSSPPEYDYDAGGDTGADV